MKKLLSALLLVILVASLLTLSVAADVKKIGDDYVEDGEFVIASYNGTKNFIKGLASPDQIEDACYWLLQNKDNFNLKYVSFLGQLTGSSKNNYYNTVVPGYMDTNGFLALFGSEDDWKKEFKALGNATGVISEDGIPMGYSLAMADFYGGGYNRNTYVSEYLSVEEIMPEGAKYEYLDDTNYYTVIENGDTKYLVFQLEVYPRAATLEWFNKAVSEHPDKYVIVYTNSLIDNNGEMYTLFDWDKGQPGAGDTSGTSQCDNINFFWYGNPTDGITTWNKAFDKHTNILAVVTSYISSNDIIIKKFTNSLGVDIAVIAANVSNGIDAQYGPTFLMTKLSPDNKTITCSYAVAFDGYIEESVKSLTLDNIGTLAEPLTNDALPQIPTQYNGANKAYIFGYEGNTFRPNANMTRAEACTIFARLILGSQTIPDGYNTRFTDVKESDWFYNAVAFLDQTGYFFRNKNTTYKPNEPITRAEFVDLANSASNLVAKNAGVQFIDVPSDHFYYTSIIAAAASGLVNGYEDNTFRPDNTITRAEVVTVINRLLGLKATAKTISEKHLENEFVDIGTHWARLNILMASNSNVHGDYYYNATLDGVYETTASVTLKNKHFSIVIDKKTGKVTSINNLYTNTNINENAANPHFIYMQNENGTKILVSNITPDGNRLKFTFKNGDVVYMIVDIEDNYMTFEIDSELPSGMKSVTFANLMTNIKASDDDESFKLNGIGMTAWTNPVNKGYSATASKQTIAHAYTIYDAGVMGAKMGVVFSKDGDHIKYLQELTDAIDPSVGLTSKAGGAYSYEWEGNFGDYIITTNIDPEALDANLALAKEFDIDQYDIHQGGNTFRQGDFVFSFTETGTAKEYYEKIGKKIEAAGLKTGLHTYAYYVSYGAVNITANPKWQEQLETLETYTLRKKLTKFKNNIATVEDATNFDTRYTFFYRNSPYVRIDNEIIRIGQGTTSGFINVQRGQCGTEATVHEAGSIIYHLGGYFNMFAPILGSELFYHIADLTAKTYNDGGFDMIYLDAIDGLGNHLGDGEESWYYFHMFVQRILSQCKRTPIVETSSTAPQEWNFRGRIGAWDYATHSYKKHIANHVSTNIGTINNNMTTTLGWFSFFPDKTPEGGMKNTIHKTMFRDDLDFLGMNALLYDMSMVVEGFSAAIKEQLFHYDNVKYYTDIYTKLRKSHYFTDDVIEKVKSIGGEWKVIEKGANEYAFLQMYYNKKNLVYARDYSDNTLVGNNPFDSQTPFIRIESRWSTLFENPITLASFDKNTELGSKSVVKSCAVDMTNNMALVVNVKGTGVDGDALLISLKGTASSGTDDGHTDHFIDLNFEGWREFILIDADNAEYDVDKYQFSGIETRWATYSTYRTIPPYKNITKVSVLANTNSATKAQISDIVAYTHVEAPVENPTVTIGSSSITFNCTIKGGEYIEYYPETGKATLFHNAEQTKEDVGVTGSVNVPAGSFSATYSATAKTNAPIRARLVIGFTGQEITN